MRSTTRRTTSGSDSRDRILWRSRNSASASFTAALGPLVGPPRSRVTPDATSRRAADHGGMGWIGRHWPRLLVTVMMAALAFGVAVSLTSPPTRLTLTNEKLATALGDTGDAFGTPRVTCRSRSGIILHVAYNRLCMRTDIDGFVCPANETKTEILVRVRDDRYHIVDEWVAWAGDACG